LFSVQVWESNTLAQVMFLDIKSKLHSGFIWSIGFYLTSTVRTGSLEFCTWNFHPLIIYLFIYWCSGGWTQGLLHARQTIHHLSHAPSTQPFCLNFVIWEGVSLTLPGTLSASQVARITGRCVPPHPAHPLI
jgi:hypothetical protein